MTESELNFWRIIKLEARKRKGSLRAWAIQQGINPTTFTRHYNGTVKPTLPTIFKYLRKLDLRLQLISNTDNSTYEVKISDQLKLKT